MRHIWEPRDDDDDELVEAPLKILSWPIEFSVSSTLLDTQQLEEIEAFISWPQDIASISS
jgi:hypothetical protein